MSINLDPKIIMDNTLSDIFAAIVLFLLGLIFLDKKKVLNPWVYKYFSVFGKTFIKYLFILFKIIFHPLFRIALATIFLILINYRGGDLLLSLLVFVILISFFWKSKFKEKFFPVAKVSDDFRDINKWKIKTGEPKIESDFGKPASALGLKLISGTNSFVILKDMEVEQGIIECDFYLEQNSLFNIIFFYDEKQDKWYGARYDSRENYSDGFLIKDQGPGANWKNYKMSGTNTSIKKWYRARIEFNSTKVAMYKDGELLRGFTNPIILGKSIGMFNEVGDVHVDNFSFIDRV